ncbi:MAG TPA: PA2169 family four-helix-bundle protein [Chthoniobacteraceae bacterium]|jgi:uncharacterized protein (TIGR02284 family)|nr:PA2169 family four-helix-bundle protein [Chthoniobacteraceae bacterium]
MSTNTTATLNDLIETLKEGEEGFRSAAHDAHSPDLKSLFSDYSNQRAQFAGQLQELARSLGDSDPADSPSFASTLHRGWMNVKAAFTGHDDHAILEEAERGEDVTKHAFEDALSADLPPSVRQTVMMQADAVRAAHDRVRDLRDSLIH